MTVDLLDDEELLDLGERADRTDPAAVTAEERRKRRALPSTNDALAAWQESQGANDIPVGDDRSCHVCGRDGRTRCRQCSRPACAEHAWVMLGLCAECATEERVQRFHRDAQPEDENWLTSADQSDEPASD